MMTHVVEALGSSKGPELDTAAVTMVDVATNVGSDESVSRRFVTRRFLRFRVSRLFASPRLVRFHLVPEWRNRAYSIRGVQTTR